MCILFYGKKWNRLFGWPSIFGKDLQASAALLNSPFLEAVSMRVMFLFFLTVSASTHSLSEYFFQDFIYLFLDRGDGMGKRGRETSICGCLLHAPQPGPQPRHVPWVGIKPVTLWFSGRCSIHWDTPAWAHCQNILLLLSFVLFNSNFMWHFVLIILFSL